MSKKTIELEEGWCKISTEGINRIIEFLENDNQSPFLKKDYSALYTVVYDMCTQPRNKNFSQTLYERFGQTLENYIEKYKIPILKQQESALNFLISMSIAWEHYKTMAKWLKHFFQYLDRHHVTQNSLPSLQNVAFTKFQTLVIEDLKDKIVQSFLEILQKDRESEIHQRDAMKEVHSMLLVLDNQIKEESQKLCPAIERNVLQDTYNFYAGKSAAWIGQDSLSDYLKKAEDHLIQENQRCVHVMGEASWKNIQNKYLEIVIKDKIQILLEKETGVLYLLTHEKRADLSRLHKLTVEIKECQLPISLALTKFIKSEGENVIGEKLRKNETSKTESPEDPEFVKNLMNLQLRFKSLLAESFKNDSTYQRAMNFGFEEIVNKRIGKYPFAEILACYADRILKKTNSRMTEAEVEENLSKIIELFEHLEDKQLFAEIFKNQLATRLLNDLSANEDAEKSIISKMKMCCGSNFTSKLEGMNNDLHLAQEILTAYKKMHQNLPIEFSVQVLTNSYWPSFKNQQVQLPKDMQVCMDHFKMFYSHHTQHRKLFWMISKGSIEVSREFNTGRYDFVCSPYQGLTLCLFNENPELSYKDVKTHMGFDDDFCKKVLNIFMNPKHRVLEKLNGDTKKVNEEDSFRINQNFQNPIRRIKLPVPSQEENYEKEKVAEDRNHAIDASIVRIMKMRKSLAHNSLIQEVIMVLQNFRPQIRDIKQRIENLISREFLERDKNDSTKYNYLA
ncbi:hypothetical protein SteCoe_28150 [Stentor coeruleus]|uniref:Cullin family profile domain-containing protein n=1 Tax=Stentor coeruleus TaxID=5963 RepID=A0A1R2B934_9CILI|nr:hypothetical protein SteCoe_28150 [Stentor coeruleus]